MELEELKTAWRALDMRVGELDERMAGMAAAVARERFASAAARLRRRLRLMMAVCCLLPSNLWMLLRRGAERPDDWLMLSLGIFVAVVLVRQLLLLDRLRRIDPLRQTVREACAAAVRFRRCFLGGVAVGVCLAVPVLIGLGLCMMRQGDAYMFYGFVAGLAIGLPVGVCVYRSMRRDVDALQEALDDLDA